MKEINVNITLKVTNKNYDELVDKFGRFDVINKMQQVVQKNITENFDIKEVKEKLKSNGDE